MLAALVDNFLFVLVDLREINFSQSLAGALVALGSPCPFLPFAPAPRLARDDAVMAPPPATPPAGAPTEILPPFGALLLISGLYGGGHPSPGHRAATAVTATTAAHSFAAGTTCLGLSAGGAERASVQDPAGQVTGADARQRLARSLHYYPGPGPRRGPS